MDSQYPSNQSAFQIAREKLALNFDARVTNPGGYTPPQALIPRPLPTAAESPLVVATDSDTRHSSTHYNRGPVCESDNTSSNNNRHRRHNSSNSSGKRMTPATSYKTALATANAPAKRSFKASVQTVAASSQAPRSPQSSNSLFIAPARAPSPASSTFDMNSAATTSTSGADDSVFNWVSDVPDEPPELSDPFDTDRDKLDVDTNASSGDSPRSYSTVRLTAYPSTASSPAQSGIAAAAAKYLSEDTAFMPPVDHARAHIDDQRTAGQHRLLLQPSTTTFGKIQPRDARHRPRDTSRAATAANALLESSYGGPTGTGTGTGMVRPQREVLPQNSLFPASSSSGSFQRPRLDPLQAMASPPTLPYTPPMMSDNHWTQSDDKKNTIYDSTSPYIPVQSNSPHRFPLATSYPNDPTSLHVSSKTLDQRGLAHRPYQNTAVDDDLAASRLHSVLGNASRRSHTRQSPPQGPKTAAASSRPIKYQAESSPFAPGSVVKTPLPSFLANNPGIVQRPNHSARDPPSHYDRNDGAYHQQRYFVTTPSLPNRSPLVQQPQVDFSPARKGREQPSRAAAAAYALQTPSFPSSLSQPPRMPTVDRHVPTLPPPYLPQTSQPCPPRAPNRAAPAIEMPVSFTSTPTPYGERDGWDLVMGICSQDLEERLKLN